MRNTFRGGIHPEERKELSRNSSLRAYDAKGEMAYPLAQHIGKPAKAIVQPGDAVKVGQILAEADGFVSAHVISSCSGTVKGIEQRATLSGPAQTCVIVDNDGKYTPAARWDKRDELSALSDKDILERVKAAGIVGMGGAGFPTHVKLQPKDPSAIRYVIANGAECEPYLTGNDWLMRTRATEILDGLTVILRLFPNAEGVVAIEENKPEALDAMRQAAQGKERIQVLDMKTKYPQGGERSLIQAIAGKDFKITELPADAGCIVDNVGTIYAVGKAVLYKEALCVHAITVSGDAVQEPCNLLIRNGMSFAELLDAAGGVKDGVRLKKALAGGPMMGIALASLEIPVQKNNNGFILLSVDENEKVERQQTACLHCGRCTTVCPTGLMPFMMADAAEREDFDRYENALYGLECITCVSCSYICPAKRPLTETFKDSKAAIMARKRAGGR